MKTLLLFFSIITGFLISSAQEVVSSSGETQTASGYELSWTLGEAAIQTLSSGSDILTQGFHQTKLTITAIDQPEILNFNVKVYPNPTSDYVVVHFDKNYPDSHIVLYDLLGRKLQENFVIESDTHLNMTSYSSGTYILKLLNGNNHSLQSFKIVKQ